MRKIISSIIISAFTLGSYGLSPAPQTVYVGYGTWGSPYYSFYSDSNGNNPINLAEYEFYHGTQYTFTKILGTQHPFFISDIPDFDGSYHMGYLSTNIVVTHPGTVSRISGITLNTGSLTFNMNAGYTNNLYYYCTRSGHASMVKAFNTSPPHVSQNQLIITEISPADDLVEVTYFDNKSAILPRDFYFVVDGLSSSFIPEGTIFTAGESKTFSVNLSNSGSIWLYSTQNGANNATYEPMMCGLAYGTTQPTGDIHSTNAYEKLLWKDPEAFAYFSGASNSLRLVAFDATNPDFWLESSSDLNSFYDEQVVSDLHPDILIGDVKIGLNLVTDGVNHPIGIVDPNDDSGRLFVLQQTGEILSVDSDYNLNTNPILDISDELVSLFSFPGYDERGLLGFAFHPNYLGNNKFYYYASYPVGGSPDYSFPVGYDGGENVVIDHHSVVIEETYVDNNLNGVFDQGDSVTNRRELIRFEQPLSENFPVIGSNHNGGNLSFDSNGYLLIAVGDGGDANDTGNGHGVIGTGADPSNIWGSILRIDPDGTNSINGAYGIPADNPFINEIDKLDEIYAYGFRNPWNPSADPVSGIIYSTDSGQNNVQEINRVEWGKFHGWRAKEGSYLFDTLSGNNGTINNPINLENEVLPIAEYDHDQGYANIIGGHVYRGTAIPELQGAYICGDYGAFFGWSGTLLYYQLDGTIKELYIGASNRDLNCDVRAISKDASGELYLSGNGGTNHFIYKIVPLVDLSLEEISDQMHVTIIGDEGSTLSLIEMNSLDSDASSSTNVLNSGGGIIRSINTSGFFKGIAE